MPLGVASALARLGAGRLAQLSRTNGTAALASMTARMSLPNGKASGTPRIAARLISLLPTNGARTLLPQEIQSRPRSKWPNTLPWLLCLALIAAAVYGAVLDPPLSALGAPISVSKMVGPSSGTPPKAGSISSHFFERK
jgi:hypothetical protein